MHHSSHKKYHVIQTVVGEVYALLDASELELFLPRNSSVAISRQVLVIILTDS